MKKNPTLLLVVAVALRNSEGKFLLQKRPESRSMSGLWEFPGGKIENNETPEDALVRELSEELDIAISTADLRPLTFASEPLSSQNLLLLLYVCDRWEGDPKPVESPEIKWFFADEMYGLEMPPADLPFLDQLKKLA